MKASTKKLASIGEVADFLGVSTRTVRRRIADGTFTAYRVPGSKNIRLNLVEVESRLRPIPTVDNHKSSAA